MLGSSVIVVANAHFHDAEVDKNATASWENEGGHIDENKEKKMSCCSDVMKPIEPSSCCTPKETAVHAAQAMRKSGCGCAPVVENTETRKLVGVVTERDVCCGVTADDRKASDVGVAEIMKPSSACCHRDDSMDDARRKLHEHQVRSLPVVDNAGCCCGTVSVHHL